MEFKSMKLSELNKASYNPRIELVQGDEEYEKLKRSIEGFGYVEPIIWNKTTGNIVGGHQRFNVLNDLGYEEIPVFIIEIEENKEKALNIALNKINGHWDEFKLKDLLLEIKESDIDVELTGFDDLELDAMLEDLDLEGFFEEESSNEEEVESNIDDVTRLETATDLLLKAHKELKQHDDYLESDLYHHITEFLAI